MGLHWNFQTGLLILVSLAMLSCWLRERRESQSQRERNFNLVDSLISHLRIFKIGHCTHAHTHRCHIHTLVHVFGKCLVNALPSLVFPLILFLLCFLPPHGTFFSIVFTFLCCVSQTCSTELLTIWDR